MSRTNERKSLKGSLSWLCDVCFGMEQCRVKGQQWSQVDLSTLQPEGFSRVCQQNVHSEARSSTSWRWQRVRWWWNRQNVYRGSPECEWFEKQVLLLTNHLGSRIKRMHFDQHIFFKWLWRLARCSLTTWGPYIVLLSSNLFVQQMNWDEVDLTAIVSVCKWSPSIPTPHSYTMN